MRSAWLIATALLSPLPLLAQTVDTCPPTYDSAKLQGRVPLACSCSAQSVLEGIAIGESYYTFNSSLCRAALHDGKVGPEGGAVVAVPFPAGFQREGATRNGVLSRSASSQDGGFRFTWPSEEMLRYVKRAQDMAAIPSPAFDLPDDIRKQVGNSIKLTLPPPPTQALYYQEAEAPTPERLRNSPTLTHLAPVVLPPYLSGPILAALPTPPSVTPTVPPRAAPAAPSTLAAPVPTDVRELEGGVDVIDTGTLAMGGRRLSLFGVSGVSGPPAEGLKGYLRGQGGRVKCVMSDVNDRWRCSTPKGTDIATIVLFNGGGKATPEAPAAYKAQEAAARNAKKGVWAQ